MHILVIGAAGMTGRKLVAALTAREEFRGRPIERLTLADIVAPEMPKFGGKAEAVAADLSALGFQAEKSFDEIIRVHIEDELGGTLPA